jgi:hypothetical protein
VRITRHLEDIDVGLKKMATLVLVLQSVDKKGIRRERLRVGKRCKKKTLVPCPCTPRTVSLIARANTKHQNRLPFLQRDILTTMALINDAIAVIKQEELREQLVY